MTVETERLVPVDPALTYAQDAPTRELVTWLDALLLGIEYRALWLSCEQRMSVIRELPDG